VRRWLWRLAGMGQDSGRRLGEDGERGSFSPMIDVPEQNIGAKMSD
jgi:hypothetical protein